MGKLGSVKLTIKAETLNTSVSATVHPVEKGSPITDHIQQNVQTLDIQGVVVGKDYRTRLTKLRDYMRAGKVLKYVGRTNASNVIILDISDSRNTEIKNGSEISIKLQYVRFAENSWKKKKKKPVSNSGKKKPVTNKPTNSTKKYHTVKKGESYWTIGRKYGVSTAQLQKMNKWTAKNLPIGAKVRYK